MINPRRRRGFTLVELLVVAAITVALSAYAVTYSRESKGRIALTVEKAKTGLFIQRAKSLALATRLRDDLERPCGYGVEIDYAANALKLFTYTGSEESPCKMIGTPSFKVDTGKDIIETVGLAQGITFLKGSSDKSEIPLEQVFFKAPDPTTFLWIEGFYPDQLSGIPGFAAEVVLKLKGSSMKGETVKVSNVGEVSF